MVNGQGAPGAPTIGLRGVAFHVGEIRPIDELPHFQGQPQALERFKSRGFGHYTRSPLGLAEQAVVSARATLRAAALSAGDIDAVVLGIVELRWFEGQQEDIGAAVLRGLGFGNMHLVGVGLGGCTNLTGLLRIARNLILAEGYRNVLVIETNKCTEDGSRRIVTPDVSVFSDGAASCVVTREAPEFALRSLVQVTTPVDTARAGTACVLAHRMLSTRFVFERALREARTRRAEVKQYFMPNHGLHILEMYSDRMKVPRPRIHTANLFWLAHAWSADTLINLHAYGQYNDIEAGDRFMIISWAESNFTALVLQALVAKPAQKPNPTPAPATPTPSGSDAASPAATA